jgi:hypothetical protein
MIQQFLHPSPRSSVSRYLTTFFPFSLALLIFQMVKLQVRLTLHQIGCEAAKKIFGNAIAILGRAPSTKLFGAPHASRALHGLLACLRRLRSLTEV